jgi:hypothetical protein
LSIEEAKFILNNVEISNPNVKSQVFIDSTDINLAIATIIQNLEDSELEIMDLEARLTEFYNELDEPQKEKGIFTKVKSSFKNVQSLGKNKNYKTMISF